MSELTAYEANVVCKLVKQINLGGKYRLEHKNMVCFFVTGRVTKNSSTFFFWGVCGDVVLMGKRSGRKKHFRNDGTHCFQVKHFHRTWLSLVKLVLSVLWEHKFLENKMFGKKLLSFNLGRRAFWTPWQCTSHPRLPWDLQVLCCILREVPRCPTAFISLTACWTSSYENSGLQFIMILVTASKWQ